MLIDEAGDDVPSMIRAFKQEKVCANAVMVCRGFADDNNRSWICVSHQLETDLQP